VNCLLWVGVGDAFDFFVDAHLHAQLLLKLAPETFLKTLARLALAAGKLPQASEVPADGTLRDEELAGAEDEAGADLDYVRGEG
jgi:hypothetical protein